MQDLHQLLDQGITAPPESVTAVNISAASEEASLGFAEVATEIQAHMQGEEAAFYPRLRPEMEDRIREAEQEHGGVKAHLQQLGRPTVGMRVGDARWLEGLEELNQLVRHHIEEEERSILPRARELLGDETLQELSWDFEEVKRMSRRAKSTSPAAVIY